AIVGASDKGLYPAVILQNLLEDGYAGEIYPVNPRRQTLFGLPCYADLTQLPATTDLAVIIVPRQAVLPVIDQCQQLGIPAALIITAGFGESDAEGKALEAALVERARRGPTAIIGPNCAGLADIAGHTVVTRLAPPLQPGPVSFVSASGALMMALYGVFADANVGLSKLLSLGNQADVGLAEALTFLVADAQTGVISAFIEGINDGAALVAAAQVALAQRKPVVLLKSGRTVAGQQAAASHTAALAGSDRVFRAVCHQFGIVQVADIDELVQVTQLFASWLGRWPQGRQMMLVTQSGGLGSLTADFCALAGLTLPPLSEPVRAKVQALPHMLAFDTFGNPADVRGAGVMGAVTTQTLAPFLADPHTDVVILLLAKSAQREDALPTAEAIIAAAQGSSKPLCVVWAGQQQTAGEADGSPAWQILRKAGIPIFTQPGDCIRAVAKVIAYAEQSAKRNGQATIPSGPLSSAHPMEPPHLLSYRQTASLLQQYGIQAVVGELVDDVSAAVGVAQRIGYPVVAKVITAAHTHKSETGLVRLNLQTEAAVQAAVQSMLITVADAEIEGILIQPMVQTGVEASVGLAYDPQFGPVLACGLGGVLVELFDEVALRLPPLTRDEAEAMIEATKLGRLLTGLRGRPPADQLALADLLVKLSQLAAATAEHLVALDLNPVIVLPAGQGLALVDVRVLWRDG
ncbi:MAG: acetate--CoA ligase family protein, partial [Chloroflexota bacterium]|nr:acetate--CoA ligase family protein [Chloroflexota bacterium]